jgi:hypothetical protein
LSHSAVDDINDILPADLEVDVAVSLGSLDAKMTASMAGNLALFMADNLGGLVGAAITFDVLDDLAAVLNLRRCTAGLVYKGRVPALILAQWDIARLVRT